jgi:transposase
MSEKNERDNRLAVVALYKAGMKAADICLKEGLGRSTVYNILRKFNSENTIERNKGSGSSFKLSSKAIAFLKEKIKINNRLSFPKLAKMLHQEMGIKVSKWTISRALEHEGLFARSPAKKPCLSPKNIKDRFDAVSKWIYWPVDKYKKIIWSDECRFCLDGSDGNQKVIRPVNTRFDDANITKTRKFKGGSVMVWGCISYYGVGKLVVVDETLNATRYTQLLAEKLHRSATKMAFSNDFIFQQDNAPCHKAAHTMRFFKENEIKVLEWPAQSPDLNPIENLWAYMKKKLNNKKFSTKKKLIKKLKKIWRNIKSSKLEKLILSMPRRVKACFDAKGGNTRY